MNTQYHQSKMLHFIQPLFMQKISKKFEQKIETINKIKYSKKKQPQILHSVQPQFSIQLPTITNTLTNFSKKLSPSQKEANAGYYDSPTKVQTELDTIISGALRSYKNQKINKVIFASPLTNRLYLGKTYYRSGRFSTVSQQPTQVYSSPKAQRGILNQSIDFNEFKLRRNRGQNSNINVEMSLDINQLQANIPSFKVERNVAKEPDFNMFYTATEEVPSQRAARNNLRKTFVMPKKVKKTEKPVRYSPWTNQEGDDELFV